MNRRTLRSSAFAFLAALTASATAPAFASDDEPDAAPAIEGQGASAQESQVYEPLYFEQFVPRNALDMLRRIPGFDVQSDDGGRGLGTASTNVLVNGKRLSGKTDSTRDQLERIPSDNVIRIEIVEGATLDQPGLTGQVANVIVEAGGFSGQFEWRGEYRPSTERFYPGRFEASVTGSTGDLTYTLSGGNFGFRGGGDGPLLVANGAGETVEVQQLSSRPGRDNQRGGITLQLAPDSGLIANFNANYSEFDFGGPTLEVIDGVTVPDRVRDRINTNDGFNYEIGGDIEFDLLGGRLKLIGLERFEKSTFAETVIDVFANPEATTGGRFRSVGEDGERIGRAEFGWSAGGADWQLSGEAAFNRLDRIAALFELDQAGEFVAIDFPDGEAGVTEDRYEALLSYGRPISDSVTLQLVAGGEFSRLSQTGNSASQREFWRPKGSVNLAWDAGNGWDVALSFAREVGQLSFGSFLARAFIDDDNTNAGNADLVPPQSWETDLEIVKDLGAWGSTTLKLFDRQIEDRVEIVPVDGGQSPGNIDSAWFRGIDWDTTLELAPIGWKGARLDLSIELSESELTDPLTGQSRPFSGIQHREFFAGIRHDIPQSSWAWGTDFYHSMRGRNFRLTETSISNEGPLFWSAFIEHKDVLGMTIQLEASNLLGAEDRFERVIYDGFRDSAPIAFVETGDFVFGRIFRIRVDGSF